VDPQEGGGLCEEQQVTAVARLLLVSRSSEQEREQLTEKSLVSLARIGWMWRVRGREVDTTSWNRKRKKASGEELLK